MATTKVVLPAGDEKVTVTIGQGEVTETIPLAAGKTVEKDMIVGVGHVVANAYYTAGGDKADASGIGFKMVKAKKKIDGTREEVTYSYGPDSKFDLPPDDYVLIATVDLAVVEQPFTVKVGEIQDVKVALDAGVLAITAPGASKIEIFETKKDINGNRKSLGYAMTRSTRRRLPAGDYTVVSEKSDNSSRKARNGQGRRASRDDGAIGSVWTNAKGRPRAALFHEEDKASFKLFRRRWRRGRRGRPVAGTRRTARGRSRTRCR